MHKVLYLVAIFDLHSRYYPSGIHNMEINFCVAAPEETLAKYGVADIVNID